MRTTTTDFDVQVERLVELGYPALTGRSSSEFAAALQPLRDVAEALPERQDVDAAARGDHLPIVVVPGPSLAGAEAATGLLRLGSLRAISVFEPGELERFAPIPGVDIPTGTGYLLTDIDIGTDFLNVRPADALPQILDRGRTPLTVAEGVAVISQRPDMLRKNKCFSLLASRCGDKRVPALWISERRPKLGWCWNGNPHTWLGSASAGGRYGTEGTDARV